VTRIVSPALAEGQEALEDSPVKTHEWGISVAANRLVLGLVLSLFTISVVSAQINVAQSVPCDAFRKNPNGTWSPTRPVKISSPEGATVSIGPGVSFGPGVQFAGIDLYALLNQNCR